VAQDAKSGRVPLFFQPSVKGVATPAPARNARPLAANVVKSQELFLALAAAFAAYIAATVVN